MSTYTKFFDGNQTAQALVIDNLLETLSNIAVAFEPYTGLPTHSSTPLDDMRKAVCTALEKVNNICLAEAAARYGEPGPRGPECPGAKGADGPEDFPFSVAPGEWMVRLEGKVLPHTWNSAGAAQAGLEVERKRNDVTWRADGSTPPLGFTTNEATDAVQGAQALQVQGLP